VPFPRNPDFVGRSDDLKSLHAVLQKREPVGIRPAGLTGMGGIGKTQLAVEYVYRHKTDYPGGIFWVNAAEPLAQGLARVGAELRPETFGQSLDQQLKAAFQELKRRPEALLVLDNLADPAVLTRPVGSEPSPLTLACRILFTTRRRELGRFHPVEISVLPEVPALELLLSHPRRRVIRDDPNHPERPEARVIGQLLGYLPLALELAGAFLGENPEMPLADYRQRLQEEGCIPTMDEEVGGLSEANFQPTHEAAIAATLKAQWDVLKPGDEESARLVFRVAGQFSEAAAIPVTTLGLLSEVSRASRRGHRTPLDQALKRLHDVRLVEELLERHVRLHPLVREFSAALTPPEETSSFHHACACRVARAFEDFTRLEWTVRADGIDALNQTLTTALAFASESDDGVRGRLSELLRLFQREGHHLRGRDSVCRPAAFAQQVLFRAVTLGDRTLAARAEQRLAELAQPALVLRWRTLRESTALVRVFAGHSRKVFAVTYSPDGRRLASGGSDGAVVWDAETGSRLLQLAAHWSWVHSVAFSPDGRWLAAGVDNGTVAVWDAQTGNRLLQLAEHRDWVHSVAFSPDGRRLASGAGNGTMAVWDVQTGKRLRVLTGHRGRVHSVAFSPDGRRLASGADNGTVAVWDAKTENGSVSSPGTEVG
jgi:hypothetical protein